MRENLESKLQAYVGTDAYAFHMPGHKRLMNPFTYLRGDQPEDILSLDITEIDGFDNLHDARGVLRDEMDAAAEMYGVKETFFSVNGSTCALLAAISAAVPAGGRILIERACHMAVYHAAYLRGLHVEYTENIVRSGASGASGSRSAGPGQAENGGKSGGPQDSDAALAIGLTRDDSCPDFDAVVITSPTYEGCIKDVAAWADFAHAHGAVLIVDEAHGAHLGFHPYFPKSAVSCGADIVVQSTHKTLPAMTQTALLHNVSGRVSGRRLQFFMDIYETSSPSYVLMASITSSLRLIRERGEELFGQYAERLAWVRRELCGLKYFALAGGEEAVLARADELPPYEAGTRMDPGKLLLMPIVKKTDADAASVLSPNLSLSRKYGTGWLYRMLRDKYHLQMEMRTADYCLAMTSIADTQEGFERLVCAMREIDGWIDEHPEGEEQAVKRRGETHGRRLSVPVVQMRERPCTAPESPTPGENCSAGTGMSISAALDAAIEEVLLNEAAGRVCADFVILYPPDVPLIVPGEIYTSGKISEIREWIERGFSVLGVDIS